MEQTEVTGPSRSQPGEGVDEAPPRVSSGSSLRGTAVSSQSGIRPSHCGCSGGTCTCGSGGSSNGGSTMPYIYALGRVEPRFPKLSVEKEFAQAIGRGETAGLTDREALHRVLSQTQNRYLVRQLC